MLVDKCVRASAAAARLKLLLRASSRSIPTLKIHTVLERLPSQVGETPREHNQLSTTDTGPSAISTVNARPSGAWTRLPWTRSAGKPSATVQNSP